MREREEKKDLRFHLKRKNGCAVIFYMDRMKTRAMINRISRLRTDSQFTSDVVFSALKIEDFKRFAIRFNAAKKTESIRCLMPVTNGSIDRTEHPSLRHRI